MKKLKFIIASFVMAMLLFIPFNVHAGSYNVDKILDYTVIVTPRSDATLDITYSITWKVLSNSEGALEYATVGVPNKYVNEIRTTTPDIVSDCYYTKDDGAVIRCDFRKKYYAGDSFTFGFSVHQERIFYQNGDYIEFAFIPGWFEYIVVEKATVKISNNITPYQTFDGAKSTRLSDLSGSSSGGGTLISCEEEGNYYVWSSSLRCNEKIVANIRYAKNSFPGIDLSKGYSDNSTDWKAIIIAGLVFLGVVLLIMICKYASRYSSDGYAYYRGYTGRSYRYRSYAPWWWYRPHGINRHGHHIPASSGLPTPPASSGGHRSSGGGHSCACACACACAGGGRAGCSRKDFYNSPSVEKILESLEK